ncbi:CLUMA_CG006358, isoform A [Clunio marinus]|uniref:CLUMA_CG006358, isoform A n=1 Tax=Clunio marinus TaxID=568069 RepID=A0A1J1HZE8_9DIPT|nr:CLUMA_CG006358, isoform A [Clunio marinus]
MKFSALTTTFLMKNKTEQSLLQFIHHPMQQQNETSHEWTKIEKSFNEMENAVAEMIIFNLLKKSM